MSPLRGFFGFFFQVRWAVLLLAGMLAVPGCDLPRAPMPAPLPLSPGAQNTYDYLVYVQSRSALERLAGGDHKDEAVHAEFLRLQDQAARALDRLISRKSTPMRYAEQGSLYFNLSQAGTAKAIFKKGLDRYPGDQALTSLLAGAYLMEGSTDSAVTTMEEYLALSPDDTVMRQRLGEMLVDAGRFGAAVEHLERIPEAGRSSRARLLLAKSLFRTGRNAEAVTILVQLAKDEPEVETLAELAYIYERSGRYQASRRIYERILDLGGMEDAVRLRLMVLSLKLKEPDRALRYAQEGPEEKTFLLQAAMLLIDAGHPRQAEALIDRLGRAEPVPGEYYYYKAYVAIESRKDAETALEYLDRIGPDSEIYGQGVEFHIQILSQLGRTRAALDLAQKARVRFPGDSRFVLLEAKLLRTLKDGSGALGVLEDALHRTPNDASLLMAYASFLEESGARDTALQVMERVLSVDPNQSDALNYIGYTLAEEGRDLDRALLLVQRALQGDPDNGYIVDSLAWVYHQQGNAARAWEEIQRAVDLVDGDATIWEHYGDIARSVGQRALARKGYQYSLGHNPKDPDAIRAKIEGL